MKRVVPAAEYCDRHLSGSPVARVGAGRVGGLYRGSAGGLVAGAAGLALCQGMQWSLPSGSTHQLQRELKNAVCLEFFAWLIT